MKAPTGSLHPRLLGFTSSLLIGILTIFMTGWNFLGLRFPNAVVTVFLLWFFWILFSLVMGPFAFDTWAKHRHVAMDGFRQFLVGSSVGFVLSFPSGLAVLILLSYVNNTM